MQHFSVKQLKECLRNQATEVDGVWHQGPREIIKYFIYLSIVVQRLENRMDERVVTGLRT